MLIFCYLGSLSSGIGSVVQQWDVCWLTLLQIPKPNQAEGLGIQWPAQSTDMDKLKTLFNELKAKI